MALICDNGEGNEMCEACLMANREALELSKIILKHFVNKKLTDSQMVLASTIAFLDSLDSIAADQRRAAALLIGQTLIEWLNSAVDEGKSQSLDLKISDNVANVMGGNKTLN